jgi:hypothetical protein
MADDAKAFAAMFVPDYHTRETSCLLKAVDPARARLYPAAMTMAVTAVEGSDNRGLTIGQRLELRTELARIMEKLTGYHWRIADDDQRRKAALASEDGREFWLDTWGFLQKHAPHDVLFELFDRDDLLDELDDDEAEQ